MLIGGVSATSHIYPKGSLSNLQQLCVGGPGGARTPLAGAAPGPVVLLLLLLLPHTLAGGQVPLAAALLATCSRSPAALFPLAAGSAGVCSLVIQPTRAGVADYMNLAEVEVYGSDGAQLPRSGPPAARAAGGCCAPGSPAVVVLAQRLLLRLLVGFVSAKRLLQRRPLPPGGPGK